MYCHRKRWGDGAGIEEMHYARGVSCSANSMRVAAALGKVLNISEVRHQPHLYLLNEVYRREAREGIV